MYVSERESGGGGREGEGEGNDTGWGAETDRQTETISQLTQEQLRYSNLFS